MGRKKRKKRATRPTPAAKCGKHGKFMRVAVGVPLIAAVGVAAFAFFPSDQPVTPVLSIVDVSHTTFVRKAKSLDDLLKMTPKQLAKVDIAEMNLLCAAGLPGAKKLDINHALATLDKWAKRVAFETDRHLYRVTDPRYADHYRHSEAYLRAEMLVQALCEDCGVKYDLTARHNFSFKDSRAAFIHGMIPAKGQTMADTPGGTCASMPVMYVAVGRRLGYPLKLVATKGHVFVRWAA